ncbi:MAG: hypothetical protein CML13_12305 [Puniceicoccaceae bacterium]|nr:hypothetical protein [Puniceicoccaceae bacterium]
MYPSNSHFNIAGLRYAEWSNLDSRLLWIYEGPPLGDQGTFNPWRLSAWLLSAGSLRVKGEGREAVAEAGSWIFPPFAKDTREFSKDANILSIGFWLRWPDGRGLFELPDARVLPAEELPQLERQARRLLRKVEQVLPRASVDLKTQVLGATTYFNLQRYFEDWVSVYLDAMRHLGVPEKLFSLTDERMLQAQVFLDSQPLSKPLPMERVAAAINLSLSHADRLFREAYGLSLKAYWEERRTMAAVRDLTDSKLAVKEIAFRVGFKTASSFSHWFLKRRGVYPREFRALNSE